MSMLNLQVALRQPLDETNGWGWQWYSQNTPMETKTETPFLVINLLPAPVDNAEIGYGRAEIHSGIFQIDLYTDQHIGDYEIMAKADEIRQSYLSRDPLSYNDQKVRIVRVGVGTQQRENNWYRITLEVEYQAYVLPFDSALLFSLLPCMGSTDAVRAVVCGLNILINETMAAYLDAADYGSQEAL